MLYKFMSTGHPEFLEAAWDAFALVGLEPGTSTGSGQCDLWTAIVLSNVIKRGLAAPAYVSNLNIKAFCESACKRLDALEDLWLAGMMDGWSGGPPRAGYCSRLYMDGYSKGLAAHKELRPV